MKNVRRILSLALALICVLGCVTSVLPYASAYDTLGTQGQNGQRTTSATIDPALSGSIELYKIDFTNAEKDGVWESTSYVSTGIYDPNVNSTLITNAVRDGAENGTTVLGNGETSNGYAIKGVVFTYKKVANIVQYKKVEDGVAKAMVLYRFETGSNSEATTALLKALGLTIDDRYVLADNCENLGGADTCVYFESNTLVNALRNQLATNATTVKNALETWITTNNGIAMAETDENGYSAVSGLPLGLYLMVETKVPEQTTNTTNPFFISLPMTTVDGTNSNLADDKAATSTAPATDSTDGGTSWLYDVTIYPKNETGIPSLEKTVRETMDDTGKNNNTEAPVEDAIKDGFKHYATASGGDTLEYQIISTLPSITSTATQLTTYTIVDTLDKGITYNKDDITIQWFEDEACTKLITTWTKADGKFTVTYDPSENNPEKASVMTIVMTENGLKEINTSSAVWKNASQVRRGYSDCTMRITYTAVLDSDATVNYGEMGNPNEVVLTWRRSNMDYYDTLIDDAHVFTYGIDLTKQFEGNGGNFKEVQFVLWNETDGYWVKAELDEDEGIYYVTNHLIDGGQEGHDDNDTHAGLEAQEDATACKATVFTPVTSENVDGKVIIKGLEDDEYILTEIRTANGYTLLKDDVKIVISATVTDETCDIYNGDHTTEGEPIGVVQNDDRYDSADRTNLDTVLGLGGAASDRSKTVTGQNIPQTHLEHHLLTSSATVDGNTVTMLADENGESANALAPLTIVNMYGVDMPATGDLGSVIMPILGPALVAIAAVAMFIFFIPVLRKREEDEQ